MSEKILTYLKAMSKLLTIPKFWGPVATVGFTMIYHLGWVYFGYSITLAWLWLFMIFGVFIAGLRAGLICAGFAIAYGIFALDDPSRVIQIMLTGPAMALLVGYLRRRERRLQLAMNLAFSNGNVAKMREALDLSRNLKVNLLAYSEAEMADVIEQIESLVGNTLAVVDGYKVLREEIERVNEWYADPGNVKKLQEMRDDG